MLLYRISQGVERLIREKGKEEGLSATQVRTVLFLADAHRDSKNVSSVAKRLGVAQPTATKVIDSLESKGIVGRSRSEVDRRKVLVDLTVPGREMAGKLTEISISLQEVIDELPESLQGYLHDGLIEILAEMQKRGQVSAALPCQYCRFFVPNCGKSQDRPHHCNLTGEDLTEEEVTKEWVHGEGNLRLIQRSEVNHST